jgi:hypothetical protein
MKLRKLKVVVLFLSFISISVLADAQAAVQVVPNVVTTAVPFLRISPDARSGAMGDAGIGLSPDANSGFWDLGKIPFATTDDAVGLTYTPWLQDIASGVYLVTLAGYHKLDDEQAISASVRYFNLGDIQFTDYNGTNLQLYRPREYAIDFGYSRKIGNKLGLGVALRYINSSLANGDVGGTVYKAGQTVAADLSLFHNGLNDDGQGFTYGLALSNLGGKIGYTDNAQSKDFIPANIGIGGAYTAKLDQDNKMTFDVDVNKLLVPSLPTSTGNDSEDQQNLINYHSQSVFGSWFSSMSNSDYTFSGGLEYTYDEQFMARAGYFWEGVNQGDRRYFTLGVGLKYTVFNFNFSYLVPSGNGVTRNPLSNTLRFSILFNLDNSGDNTDNTTAN